jgi:hypothetical protein
MGSKVALEFFREPLGPDTRNDAGSPRAAPVERSGNFHHELPAGIGWA